MNPAYVFYRGAGNLSGSTQWTLPSVHSVVDLIKMLQRVSEFHIKLLCKLIHLKIILPSFPQYSTEGVWISNGEPKVLGQANFASYWYTLISQYFSIPTFQYLILKLTCLLFISSLHYLVMWSFSTFIF